MVSSPSHPPTVMRVTDYAKGNVVQREGTANYLFEQNPSCDSVQVCKKSFVRNSDLKLHQRRHDKQKPYVCRRCNRAFLRSCDLSAHMRRRHHDDLRSLQLKPPSLDVLRSNGTMHVAGIVLQCAYRSYHTEMYIANGAYEVLVS